MVRLLLDVSETVKRGTAVIRDTGCELRFRSRLVAVDPLADK